MTCNCTVKLSELKNTISWHQPSCCHKCAQSEVPLVVTPSNMEAFCGSVKVIAEPYFNVYKVGFVATPKMGDVYTFGSDNLSEYGVAVSVSMELMAQNYLGTMEYAKKLAAKEWNLYFAKHGQPAWITAALKQWGEKSQSKHLTIDDIKAAKEKILQAGYAATPSWGQDWGYGKDVVSGSTVVGDLTHLLPGLQETVQCPARNKYSCTTCVVTGALCTHGQDEKHRSRCPQTLTIQRMIVHLNDTHRWARETEIADWLETLDVDLSFPAEAPPRPERPITPGENKLASVGSLIQGVYAAQIAHQQEQMDMFAGGIKKTSNSDHETMYYVDQAQVEQVSPGALHFSAYVKKGAGDWYLIKKVLSADGYLDLSPEQLGQWLTETDKPTLTPKALALQTKLEQGKQNGQFAVNPTKTRRKK